MKLTLFEKKAMKTQETTITNNASPAGLLQLAIEKDLDVEKLEKLMTLKERWDTQEAKKAFLKAMSMFQSQCPVLNKSKEVKFNQVRYSYIPLGQITAQIKELLNKCGLSYRWETKDNEGNITITCIVSHIDGHSEQNSMTAGKDKSGAKNDIQQIGSTMTYLQRYTLIGALGISSADSDIDAQQPSKKDTKLTKEQSAELLIDAKSHIDQFESAEELADKGRLFLQGEVKAGLNEQDAKILEKHIADKYQKLKA